MTLRENDRSWSSPALPQRSRELAHLPASLPAVRESWAQVSAIVRIASEGEDTWSMVELTRAHALIGRKPGCDITIAHSDLESVHTYLHFDSGGCHAVDLRTSSGMRLNGRAVTHGRFFPGDTIEVGGFRIRLDGLIVDGHPLQPQNYGESPLSSGQSKSLVPLQLRSLSRQAHYWTIHSSVAFLGAEKTCAVALSPDLGVSRIHGALIRTRDEVFFVDMASRGSQINGQHLFNDCRPLFHDDILTIGRAGLLVHRGDSRMADTRHDDHDRNAHTATRRSAPMPTDGINSETLLAALLSRIQDQHDAALERQNEAQMAMAQLLRQMQNEQSRVFDAHLERIRAMDREIVELKERLKTIPADKQLSPPASEDISRIRPTPANAPPVRKSAEPANAKAAARSTPNQTPTPEPLHAAATSSDPNASPEFTTAWLIDRVSHLENEKNSSWRDLIDRLRGR
jgi:hypothetical protein